MNIIKTLGDNEYLNRLDNLDINSCLLADKKRDELSYYHRRRSWVHLDDCYQKLITQLPIKTLVKKRH